MNKNKEAFAFH